MGLKTTRRAAPILLAAAFAAVEHPSARFDSLPPRPHSAAQDIPPQPPQEPTVAGSDDGKPTGRAIKIILPSPYRR